MYTLKGIFPETKKEQKKNFIRENMKQLKYIQGKTSKEPKFMMKNLHLSPGTETSLGAVKSSLSNKSKVTLNVGKSISSNSRKKNSDVRIKKGDMAEFLKRKEMRQSKVQDDSPDEDYKSTESSSRLRDIGCQTIESNLSQMFKENTKLTMLYPKQDDDQDSKIKASGDSSQHNNTSPIARRVTEDYPEYERKHSRIIDKKDTKDPYLPPGYQKGVIPKYLRERKEMIQKEVEGTRVDETVPICPPGHVTLPDNERKETLRMLRNSFAELVNELNKMPVKTDTLRMRNRKMELEKQLTKLEEGIKVFSRPKVFVKIGE